jgi:methionine synthase II (cobalamin-independent)
MRIKKEISISELVSILPEAVNYLMNKGIKCIACGEAIWGSLEESAWEKGFKEHEIQKIVEELNEIYARKK